MPLEDEKPTYSATAVRQLRDEILSGEIAPGAKLHVRDLCDRLGISVSPVREALNQLTAQGLVQHSSQRGFTVPPANIDDLADLTLARVVLNEAAVRDAIANGDAAWEEGVLLAHHRLSRADRSVKSGPGGWEALHRRFHMALVEGCRSKRVVAFCEQLFDMADRYRIVSRLCPGETPRDTNAEHAAIMRAALDRDADETVHLLNDHVELTDRLVREALIRAN